MPPKSNSGFSLYRHLVLSAELFWTSSAASSHEWPNWTAAGLAVTEDMDPLGQMCAVSLVPSPWNATPHTSTWHVPKVSSTIGGAKKVQQ